jgi:hypothetical protein
MSYKLITFDKVAMGAKRAHLPVDGDIAQFLNMLDT